MKRPVYVNLIFVCLTMLLVTQSIRRVTVR